MRTNILKIFLIRTAVESFNKLALTGFARWKQTCDSGRIQRAAFTDGLQMFLLNPAGPCLAIAAMSSAEANADVFERRTAEAAESDDAVGAEEVALKVCGCLILAGATVGQAGRASGPIEWLRNTLLAVAAAPRQSDQAKVWVLFAADCLFLVSCKLRGFLPARTPCVHYCFCLQTRFGSVFSSNFACGCSGMPVKVHAKMPGDAWPEKVQIPSPASSSDLDLSRACWMLAWPCFQDDFWKVLCQKLHSAMCPT